MYCLVNFIRIGGNMKQTNLTGKAQTVLGAIDCKSLGITLTHEHLILDGSIWFIEPTEATERGLAHQPVSLENLWWVRSHPLGNLDDGKILDEKLAIKEALLYKWAGGKTIVELTNIGLARDPLGLARIARATGLNIIMGAGYYVALSHPLELATKSEEEIAQEIIRDIMVGVGNTGVRAGIIGEIGCSMVLEEDEKKVLRASAIAQRHTGAAISIHNEVATNALEIIEILNDFGADLTRTVMSHVDSWGYNLDIIYKLLKAGCYLEYDTFGWPVVSLSPPKEGQIKAWTNVIEMKSDTQRIDDIIQFISKGYLSQILISQDYSRKHALTAYGGFGYAHILRDTVPVMLGKGMTDKQIHTLLVENPKRLLAFSLTKD